ncbi:MAG: hypothetical protein GY720_01685 [bacterium]|nr:hypothetical protein [bacterium]
MTIHFLQQEIGGTLEHVMKELPSDGARWDASPAPAVTLRTRDGGSLRASTAVSVGPSTTLSSAATVGARSVSLTLATGFARWEEYVIGPNVSGQWERVLADGIGSGTLTFLDPLVYAYGSGVTIKSHRLYSPVTGGTVGSVAWGAWAEWSYYVDSVRRKVATPFNVSRYAPRLEVTALDFLQTEPAARQMIGSDQKIDLMIRRRWEQVVLPDVAKILGSPGAMVSGEAVARAVIYSVQDLMYRTDGNMERANDYAELYVNQLQEATDGMVDLDESGGQSETEIPPSAHSRRMRRG